MCARHARPAAFPCSGPRAVPRSRRKPRKLPMIPDLTPIFARYAELRDEADAIFAHVAREYPDCVTCHEGCSDCCHALFDLSLVEAMAVNAAFNAAFGHGRERSDILARASEIDRSLTRHKREMFRAEKDGESPEAIMARAAALRVRCPLLGPDDRCLLYAARPITCRIYGIPTEIGGEAHVCGLSHFDKGRTYPTVRLERFHSRLDALSREIGETVQSRFELGEVYVPLSMALLTRYDEKYLGIGPAGADD